MKSTDIMQFELFLLPLLKMGEENDVAYDYKG